MLLMRSGPALGEFLFGAILLLVLALVLWPALFFVSLFFIEGPGRYKRAASASLDTAVSCASVVIATTFGCLIPLGLLVGGIYVWGKIILQALLK